MADQNEAKSLRAHHQSHAGIDRSKELLSWSWWPSQLDDIRKFVAICETCMKRPRYAER